MLQMLHILNQSLKENPKSIIVFYAYQLSICSCRFNMTTVI